MTEPGDELRREHTLTSFVNGDELQIVMFGSCPPMGVEGDWDFQAEQGDVPPN